MEEHAGLKEMARKQRTSMQKLVHGAIRELFGKEKDARNLVDVAGSTTVLKQDKDWSP